MGGLCKIWRTPKREPKTREQISRPLRQYEADRQRLLHGTIGPAGPCKRICPHTGEVLEIIAAATGEKP